MSRRLAADVVVVGAGAAGLSAAIEAADAAASVLVLEKNAQAGGSSRLSVGSINAAGSVLQQRAGIVDTPDAHFADMERYTGAFAGRDNLALRRILVDNAADTLHWLMGLGLRFHGPTAEPPIATPRMHNVLPNARAYPVFLGRAARRSGAELLYSAPVEALLRAADGGVDGVSAVIDGRSTEVAARRAVVLAAGDYSNGRALKQALRPELADIPGINPTATGDGHRMAAAIGAQLVNGDVIYGPGLRFCAPPTPPLLSRLPPSRPLGVLMALALRTLPPALFRPFVMSFMTASLGPEASLLRAGAVLVNQDGRRFTDESQPAGLASLAIAQQPGGRAWLVFDDRVARRFSGPPHAVSTAPGVAFAYIGDYRRHRRDLVHRGADVHALARSLGMPADALAAGCAPALAEPPLHALGPLESRIVITDGGLAVDTHHRVLRDDGSAIPRLYAAGAVGQGGALLAGNGHHIGWAVTSGRRAGRFAAGAAA